MRNKSENCTLWIIRWMEILQDFWSRELRIPIEMANTKGFRSFVQVENKIIHNSGKKISGTLNGESTI